MSQLRSFAGFIAVIGVSACLFAVVPASAAQQSATAKCKQTAAGHVYKVTSFKMTCAKAKSYVKTLATQRLDEKRPGELPKPPKGFKCSAYDNSKHVQTYGRCKAVKSSKNFDWTLAH